MSLLIARHQTMSCKKLTAHCNIPIYINDQNSQQDQMTYHKVFTEQENNGRDCRSHDTTKRNAHILD